MSRRLQAAVAEYEGKNTGRTGKGILGLFFLKRRLSPSYTDSAPGSCRDKRQAGLGDVRKGLGLENEWGTIHGKEALGYCGFQ